MSWIFIVLALIVLVGGIFFVLGAIQREHRFEANQVRTCDFCGRVICGYRGIERSEGLYCMACWGLRLL
jgi:hypothetical protein